MLLGDVPLAPPLGVRLIALVVIEAALLTTAVLLYIRWVELKREALDEWWARREAEGLSAKTRFAMEESERERREAEREADESDPSVPGAEGVETSA
jgi:hypothetical protein